MSVIPMAAPVIPLALPPDPVAPFKFDPGFESKVLALFVRDENFAKEAVHYLKPEHLSNALERNILIFAMEFLKAYGCIPAGETLMGQIIADSRVPAAERLSYASGIRVAYEITDTREREFIRLKVVDFCKNQALLLLAMRTPDMLAKGEADKIKSEYSRIFSMGSVTSAQFIDYFAETEARETRRAALASGTIIAGISTGFPEIDKLLYSKGWGKGELTVIMAPSKRGKTAFMIQSAVYSAIYAKSNVLFISLEVSEDILGDRADAMVSSTPMQDLLLERAKVRADVAAIAATAGKLYIERRPSNSMTTDQIDALVEQYQNKGIHLDMVVVDYIGILRLDDPKDRFVGLGNAAKELRRIAGKYGVAMITGAQTNRDAVGKTVAGMDSIGESFAIVQDCDLLISINATDAELASGVRRIYLAASRNSPDVTIKVHGDLEKMQLIQSILGIER